MYRAAVNNSGFFYALFLIKNPVFAGAMKKKNNLKMNFNLVNNVMMMAMPMMMCRMMHHPQRYCRKL